MPMFEAHIKPSDTKQVMEWINKASKGELRALIHPHTADGGLIDHTKNARWVGEPMALHLGIFE